MRQLRSSYRNSDIPASSVVSVVGGINMDLIFETERIPDSGESMDASSIAYLPGGKGANTAIALYRASHTKPSPSVKNYRDVEEESAVNGHNIRVFMNGSVGDDQFGKQLKENLLGQNVDISGVQTAAGNSGTCTVIVETLIQESRNVGYQAANLEWKARDPESIDCLAGGGGKKPDLVITHLGIPRERIVKVLRTATKAKVDTLLNPSPAHTLVSAVYKCVTHLVLNEQEAAHLSGRKYDELRTPEAWETVSQEFIELGVKNVVITLAERGAYYATHDGKKGKIEAVPDVDVKDATGAG